MPRTLPPPPRILITVAEAMERLNCSRTTIYTRIDEGLRVYKRGGRTMFDLVDIDALDRPVRR